MRGYISLIRKDSVTHIDGLVVYVKEGPHSARGLSLENSADSYLCFRLALLHSVTSGADAGGCHCCQCSTPKWLTLISRFEFSFLKNL